MAVGCVKQIALGVVSQRFDDRAIDDFLATDEAPDTKEGLAQV
jgi:hypothetical protein